MSDASSAVKQESRVGTEENDESSSIDDDEDEADDANNGPTRAATHVVPSLLQHASIPLPSVTALPSSSVMQQHAAVGQRIQRNERHTHASMHAHSYALS